MAATTMTKTQLVALMAEKIEITKKQAALFLETLAELAVKEAKKNDVFVVPGLGRLKKVQRKARTGRNPQTGEAIKIKAKTTAKFYVAKVGEGRHRARKGSSREEVVPDILQLGLADQLVGLFLSHRRTACTDYCAGRLTLLTSHTIRSKPIYGYCTILADLRAERDRINNAISALEALNGTGVILSQDRSKLLLR